MITVFKRTPFIAAMFLTRRFSATLIQNFPRKIWSSKSRNFLSVKLISVEKNFFAQIATFLSKNFFAQNRTFSSKNFFVKYMGDLKNFLADNDINFSHNFFLFQISLLVIPPTLHLPEMLPSLYYQNFLSKIFVNPSWVNRLSVCYFRFFNKKETCFQLENILLTSELSMDDCHLGDSPQFHPYPRSFLHLLCGFPLDAAFRVLSEIGHSTRSSFLLQFPNRSPSITEDSIRYCSYLITCFSTRGLLYLSQLLKHPARVLLPTQLGQFVCWRTPAPFYLRGGTLRIALCRCRTVTSHLSRFPGHLNLLEDGWQTLGDTSTWGWPILDRQSLRPRPANGHPPPDSAGLPHRRTFLMVVVSECN